MAKEKIRKLSQSELNGINRLNILGLAALIVSSKELKSFSEFYHREENSDLRQVLKILSKTHQQLNRVILQ
ncbi:hypothetical protein [Gracilimonas tropica]|uniref:hypothetical protein n=1 Tax=Gracilimonas tropica TaxID=454600 RepID=UPI00036F62D9|nr:hypothetical protein [Gracilimonas tropica]